MVMTNPASGARLAGILMPLVFALAGCGSGLAVGDEAPAFALPEAGGSTVGLADYNGKPVLLYFHMALG
jgi:hypothetical protein